MTAQLLLVNGTLETKDNVIHIIAGALYDYTHELQTLRRVIERLPLSDTGQLDTSCNALSLLADTGQAVKS